MSNSTIETPVVKVYDPRIDVLKQRSYVIEKGGSKVSYIAYKTNSTGNSAYQFQIVPPSRSTLRSSPRG